MSKMVSKTGRAVGHLSNGIYCTVCLNQGKILKPKYLWLEVTDKCNSRCEYCNIYKKKPTADPLSPEEIKKILSSSLFSQVSYIINSGGEPTVRSDVLDIFLAEHEALPKATLQYSTNGLLPERILSVVKELCRRNIKVDVGISLDGIGDAHDKIRGVKGNFEKVDYLVKKLVETQASVSLGSTLTAKNLQDNIQARKYAKNLKIPFMYHWFNTSEFYDNQGSNNDLYSKKQEIIQEIKQTVPNGIYKEMWIKEVESKQQPKFQCFALNTFAVLKCNGDIAPCLSLWDKNIGNVRNEDPQKVWNSVKAQQVRREIRYCKGCLNSWGVSWSLASSYYQNLFYKIRNKK